MKLLKELRNFDLNPSEVGSRIKYMKSLPIDWDVYLPSIGMNLQRDFVWDLNQKQELIYSILIGRHIPHLAIINTVHRANMKDDIYQIIDGKQRLSAIFNFIGGLFKIELDGALYSFSELPEEYQIAINHFHVRYYVINEPYDTPITDKEKINWFRYINFAGTPQDKQHLQKITTIK